MSDNASDDTGRIGKNSTQIDSEQPDDGTLADHLGFEKAAVDADATADDLKELVEQLSARDDADPLVATTLELLVQQNQRLQHRLDELEEQIDTNNDIATTASGKAHEVEQELADVEDHSQETREIAKSAVAKANQVESTVRDEDEQEDPEELPHGVEASSSPLDFFANCRLKKVKEIFVENQNKANSYRAVAIAKRWQEFATKRSDGSGIFWTKDNVREALTAHLGERPHRMTVKRVWDTLVELGSDDIDESRRRISNKQEPKDVIKMDIETAHGLQESRYLGLDLLEDSSSKAATGGVTPVVTGKPEETA